MNGTSTNEKLKEYKLYPTKHGFIYFVVKQPDIDKNYIPGKKLMKENEVEK